MASSDVRQLGQWLRQTREDKGITLAEAQQATKIRQAFLLGLEEENYGILPPPVYIRGFLKNYANFLGIDPREAVQRFDEVMEAVAMGMDPYAGSTDSGSADSGGRMLSPIKDTVEVVGALPPPKYNPSVDNEIISRALVPLSYQSRNLVALRTPDKYVLKPSMAPMRRTAFYIPNIMPALLVAAIIGVAVFLVYRSIALPPDEKREVNQTVTALTVPSITASANKAPTVVVTAPPYFTPDPIIIGDNKATNNTAATTNTTVATNAVPSVSTTGSANAATTNPVSVSTPFANKQPVKLELSVVAGNSSWVQIWVDDKEEVNRLVEGPFTFRFEGKEKVEIALGRPGAVKIAVNGTERLYNDPNEGVVIRAFYADGKDEKRKPKTP
jgi:cytoskeletal protein RodZ